MEPVKYFVSFLEEGLVQKNLNKVIYVITTHYKVFCYIIKTDMGHIVYAFQKITKKNLQDEISKTFPSDADVVEMLLMLLGKKENN